MAASGGAVAEHILQAQEADADARGRLGDMEAELAAKRRQLSTVIKDAYASVVPGGTEADAVRAALKTVASEEAAVQATAADAPPPLREAAASFLERRAKGEEEIAETTEALKATEAEIRKTRAALMEREQSSLPADLQRASLFVAWKRALAEREEGARVARRRKHDLVGELTSRLEAQVVMLDVERKTAVEALGDTMATERARKEEAEAETATAEAALAKSDEAMARFRGEFDQLRVALLVDRMAKAAEVQELTAEREALAKEAAAFDQLVEHTKRRAVDAEAAKWAAKVAAERAQCEEKLRQERLAIEEKFDKIQDALRERYEAGFAPVLKGEEEKHVQEVQRIADLKNLLAEREAALSAAHETARKAASAHASESEAETAMPARVVDKAREADFEADRREVLELLGRARGREGAEKHLGFLRTADQCAPFGPALLKVYQDQHEATASTKAAT